MTNNRSSRIVTAWTRWREVDPHPSMLRFDTFLGAGPDYSKSDEEVDRRLNLLLGPHYRTIIKAYLIKQGIIHE